MSDALHIERLWGVAPVQGTGTIYAFPFYFRARWDRWAFAVATCVPATHADAIAAMCGACAGFVLSKHYGVIGGVEAGVMEEEEARMIIEQCSAAFIATLFAVKARTPVGGLT